MRTRARKSASKVRCTYSLSWQDRHARIRWAQALCQAADVGLPRAHVDGCLSHRNLRHLPLEKDADACLVGRLGRGQEGATRFCCSCHKPADLHRRSRAMLEGVRAIHCPKRNRLGPERDPKLVRVHYNLRLRRKRSNPDFEDVHLAAMTIDPIDEMTSLWKMTRTQITSRKLKAGSRCAGHNPGHWHCPSVALLTPSRRRAGGFRSTRRVGVTVTSLSRGLTFHPPWASVGQWAPGAVAH